MATPQCRADCVSLCQVEFVVDIGPPALAGFPCVHIRVSGVCRLSLSLLLPLTGLLFRRPSWLCPRTAASRVCLDLQDLMRTQHVQYASIPVERVEAWGGRIGEVGEASPCVGYVAFSCGGCVGLGGIGYGTGI